ncbi:hypothetical protein SAMN04515647_4408 [Cohaesibacter sp. ES.047]|uniref:hypothetical protein n=1 Tax=Cohaesibacter sp. ES.047 TaxID=1798205 RepID=UPI000BB767F4|nr:hypothetical protein [Cohaesibacter sp. ES.047]SNY94085.1 hypothetical protein SAMN04515647_4408 [Cohaesibacter sp. ES.047]
MTLIEMLNEWSGRKILDNLRKRYGGIQSCPWCRQCAQSQSGWSFNQWGRDPFLDVLTCGVCGGQSLWRFEIGMIYIGPLAAPNPSHAAVPYYDIENAKLKEVFRGEGSSAP